MSVTIPIEIKREGRVLDSPDDFKYECESIVCEQTAMMGVTFLPDSYFPQRNEVEQYGLDSGRCLDCQGIKLI